MGAFFMHTGLINVQLLGCIGTDGHLLSTASLYVLLKYANTYIVKPFVLFQAVYG